MMRRALRRAAHRFTIVAGFGAWLLACAPREPPEVARDRAAEELLVTQIRDLETLVRRAEAGEVVTSDRIAIGITEGVVQGLLNASLPQEKRVGERVTVRIEKAQPIFRGNDAALLFEAQARGKSGLTARLELGGRLANLRVDKGRLVANVELKHFRIIETSLGDLAGGVLESLVRDNLSVLNGLVPPLEIPIRLDQAISIGGINAGPVMARGGTLPLGMSVAETIPIGERLWILLDVNVGAWEKRDEPEAAKPEATRPDATQPEAAK